MPESVRPGDHRAPLGPFRDALEPEDAMRLPATIAALHEVLVGQGDLEGRSVVDVGCGRGASLAILADRFGCRVTGVDRSPRTLERVRDDRPGADLRHAVAEELPFSDQSFDAALMKLVVQHVDRPRAFAEILRVLVPGGRFVIATLDPDALARAWMVPLFPSFLRIERRRFPSQAKLETELRSTGFSATRHCSLTVPRRFTRAYAVERIRGRYVSTFDHMSEDEYRAGLRRAELELPETVESTLEWMIVSATKSLVD
jgi:SAM-dependent methyltransferase